MRHLTLALGAAALSLGAVSTADATFGDQPAPGSARNRPGGNEVVPGGGAKERARRLKKIEAGKLKVSP